MAETTTTLARDVLINDQILYLARVPQPQRRAQSSRRARNTHAFLEVCSTRALCASSVAAVGHRRVHGIVGRYESRLARWKTSYPGRQ